VESSDGSVRGDSITVSTSPNTESPLGSRMVNPIEPDSLDGLPMLLYAIDGVDSEIECVETVSDVEESVTGTSGTDGVDGGIDGEAGRDVGAMESGAGAIVSGPDSAEVTVDGRREMLDAVGLREIEIDAEAADGGGTGEGADTDSCTIDSLSVMDGRSEISDAVISMSDTVVGSRSEDAYDCSGSSGSAAECTDGDEPSIDESYVSSVPSPQRDSRTDGVNADGPSSDAALTLVATSSKCVDTRPDMVLLSALHSVVAPSVDSVIDDSVDGGGGAGGAGVTGVMGRTTGTSTSSGGIVSRLSTSDRSAHRHPVVWKSVHTAQVVYSVV
jgi:hypothetical protein